MSRLRKLTGLAAALLLAVSAMTVNAEEQTEAGKTEKTTEAAVQANENGQVASADEMTTPEDVVEDWMVPIYGEEINDGVYEVEVLSSSSMFRVEACELTVKEGKMTAVMTMGGTGYLKLFMGTGNEAVNASEEEYIPFVENGDGKHTYEVPVEALDMGINCTAFSKNKEKWYDRVLVFKSTSLPAEAFKERKMTTAADLGLEDGTYLAEAALSGGSGKAGIDSPAEITVKDGEVTAQIIFGSPNYDYMLVNGEKYETVNTEGNSTFLIPVDGFDYNMPVVADTIAMSVPHEIDYTIFLDSATLEKVQ